MSKTSKRHICCDQYETVIDRYWLCDLFRFASERIGWIPVGEEVPEAVREQYKWVDGLSVTEMEIMHGAYRNDNPNGECTVLWICRTL